ncbi:PEP-CTERM sorting domain-containing protein [Lacipirellula sp.]|uniref:PEP-CTERM sorting domain-containing protein n=1 Tax=Lacipirellula sp. TaxID=2691419 RepID=UPI003D0BEF56
MNRLALTLCSLVFVAPCLWSAINVANAGIVNYQGQLTNYGATVTSGYVVAGTFKPTFNPDNYKYVYGIDSAGNMDSPRLTQAIADGNFIPIGAGANVAPDGSFSGSGFTALSAGTKLWFFAFDNVNADLAANFALASHSTWLTSPSTVALNGMDASEFVFGFKLGDQISVNVLPMPEPSSLLMLGAAVGVAGISVRLRRRA